MMKGARCNYAGFAGHEVYIRSQTADKYINRTDVPFFSLSAHQTRVNELVKSFPKSQDVEL
jgi:hypothetical protein